MDVKIYIIGNKEVIVPVQYQVVRYKLEFYGNPANGTGFALDIKKNGNVLRNIDKTFSNTGPSNISTTIRDTDPNVTVNNLLSNLTTFNANSSITYLISDTVNGFGYYDIYIDVTGLATDSFTLSAYSNNTSAINLVAPTVFTTYEEYESQIVEDYALLDLFNDEGIQLTSKLSDVEKLSNVFTDFSDSFTVPATPNNNAIFKHYYDIDIDNTFNANIRALAYIEVKSLPFRFGKIQLESIKLKSQVPDSYKITFYGGVVQLNDLFGDDTINQLDYKKDELGNLVKTWDSLSQFDYEYNSTNFINSINLPSFKSGSVITPLIAYTDRDWNYGTADSLDISTNAGAILDSELRPALRVAEIIKAIETKYGITFSRDFLGTATFNNLFIWLNGINTPQVLGQETPIDLIDTLVYDTAPISGWVDSDYINMSTTQDWVDIYVPPVLGNDFDSVEYWIRTMVFNMSDATTSFKVYARDFYTNEILQESEVRTGNDTTADTSLFMKFRQRNEGYNRRIKFSIKTSRTLTFDFRVIINLFVEPSIGGPAYNDRVANIRPNTQGITSVFNIGGSLPNIKVLDFLQGIMKMFKLVIRPISTTQFYINTLDGYYGDGNILDITDYVDHNEVDIQRPLIYKNIQFNYQKTNNIAGKTFRINNDPNDEIGYGDLKATYSAIESKDNLEIELPFENMLFERMTVLQPAANAGEDTNISIGQSISSTDNVTFSRNNSKPILFFNNGIASNTAYPFKIKFGAAPATVAYNYIIGNTNDELLDQVTDTLNWGSEVDPWHTTVVGNSLYLNYWSNWVNTIYDLKQRKLTYQANLPTRFVDELSLNDALIIGNSRYRINDYKVNPASGDTTLTLFKDIYNWDKYSFPYSESFAGAMFSSSLLYFTDYTENDNIYLYGRFSHYSGSSSNNLVRILPNGQRDSLFNVGVGVNSVPFGFSSIVPASGSDSVYLTGYFTQYSGSTSNRVVRINSNGTRDTSFNVGTGFNAGTNGAAVDSSGSLIVTGLFSSYSGSSSPRIVRINPNGTKDNTFNVGTGFNNTTIDVITNPDNSMVVTGYFTQYSGSSVNGIIKVKADGTVDTTFNSGTGFNIFSAGNPNGVSNTTDGNMIAFGYFTQYSGSNVNRIVKINQNGTINSSFLTGSGFNDYVFEVKNVLQDKLLVRGNFTTYCNVSSSKAIMLNNNGTIYKTYNDTNVGTFAVDNNEYFVTSTGLFGKSNLNNYFEASPEQITCNAGTKYYGINLLVDDSWTTTPIDYGFGTNWVTILTPSGEGSSECVIRVEEKASQSAPQVYQSRVMGIQFNSGNRNIVVNITQNGLLP